MYFSGRWINNSQMSYFSCFFRVIYFILIVFLSYLLFSFTEFEIKNKFWNLMQSIPIHLSCDHTWKVIISCVFYLTACIFNNFLTVVRKEIFKVANLESWFLCFWGGYINSLNRWSTKDLVKCKKRDPMVLFIHFHLLSQYND